MSTAQAVSGLISELAQRISYSKLAQEVGVSEDELKQWVAGKREYSQEEIWKLTRVSSVHGFFDLLPAHGITPVSYDIATPFDLVEPPIGYDQDPPVIPLKSRPTKIAGFQVDFPLGLPASVLAANAKWLEFYARRGFDILTYKTVRTQYREAYPWPNWVFLKDPIEITDPSNPPLMVGYPGYWPDDRITRSMANSFGVPSFGPDWWQEDVKRARKVVREGHQVLIVSVTASVRGSTEAIAEDFANAARMAKKAGADIVEANYSCPNVQGDPVGEVYEDPDKAAYISLAMRDALGDTPLLVKIGYLPEPKLRKFVECNAQFINGIVAINTISAEVVDEKEGQTFPDSGPVSRKKAGVSGWAIKARAQEVARNLVSLRKEIPGRSGKPLTILGLGGVLTRQDAFYYLDHIGVDGVESCTGAFLNPNLGLEVRLDEEAIKKRPSRLAFEFKLLGTFLGEVIAHPKETSRIRSDSQTGTIVVERG